MPEYLDDAYEAILRHGNDQELARTALSIMLAAYRPLTVGELNTAVNCTNTSHCLEDLDLEHDEDFEKRLRNACGLFVSVYGGKVDFLHQTARQFLLETHFPIFQRQGKHRVWKETIQVEAAHSRTTEICTRFVTFPDYASTFDNWPRDPLTEITMSYDMMESGVKSWLSQQNPFVSYASEFWLSHARDAGNISETARCDYEKLCEDNGNLHTRTWVVLHHWKNNKLMTLGFQRPRPRYSPAALQARFGHLSALKQTIEGGRLTKEDKDNHYFSLLEGACLDAAWCEGRYRLPTVDFLLEKRPGYPNGNIQMAQLASSAMNRKTGCSAIAPKLLHRGALFPGGVDWHNNCQLLRRAVCQRDVENFRLLLSHSFDTIREEWICGPLRLRDQTAQAGPKYQEGSLRRFDPNCRCHPGGVSLLHHAFKSELVNLLIQYGADVNARDDKGQTPIFFAQSSKTRLLLENSADIEASNNEGRTCLFEAMEEEQVHILAEYGANFNQVDLKGEGPLDAAKSLWKWRALIVHGAYPRSTSAPSILSPLLAATGTSNPVELADTLYRKEALEARDSQGATALHRLVLFGPEGENYWYMEVEECLHILLFHGADPDQGDNRGMTVLHHLCMHKVGWGAVVVLIQARADINARDALGRTPLIVAAIEGNCMVLEYLIRARADIEARDDQGRTALIAACNAQRLGTSKMLIEEDADIEARDSAGNHPKALGGAGFHSRLWHVDFEVRNMHLCDCGVGRHW